MDINDIVEWKDSLDRDGLIGAMQVGRANDDAITEDTRQNVCRVFGEVGSAYCIAGMNAVLTYLKMNPDARIE